MNGAICTSRDQSVSVAVVTGQTCCARFVCNSAEVFLVLVSILDIALRSFSLRSIRIEKDCWTWSKRVQMSVNVMLLKCWRVDRSQAPTEIDVIHASE